ncbi:hypothetical protein [Microbacterium sp. A93]|uniref:hypothetical protein n=1 Tax=Microbacterium sp. A93 TaxID=3450716 RepID=UPI003F433201
MTDHDTLLGEPLIHLPFVSEEDSNELAELLLDLAADLPELGFAVPTRHIGSIVRRFEEYGPTALVIPVVETILDAEFPRPTDVELRAQLILVSEFATVPETMAMQIAFGRGAGEEVLRKQGRFIEGARREGVSLDEYVLGLARVDAIPKDRTYQLFRGESVEIPDAERVQRGIEFLRMTVASMPEPFRPPLFGALAWLHWARGQRAIAMAYLADATRIEPDNILAGGLSVFFRSVTPDWLEVGP